MDVMVSAVVTAWFLLSVPQSPSPNDALGGRLIDLVKQIQRSDYAGDRPALIRLHEALNQFTDEPTLRSRAHYWRGFALWRRSINGFNDAATPEELERDLLQAIVDFRGVNRRPAAR
jgi:hypothetical protein